MLVGYSQKNKKTTENFKETQDVKYIYQNELDTTCFQHDLPSGDFKDLTNITASDKVLRDKAFNIAKKIKNKKNIYI